MPTKAAIILTDLLAIHYFARYESTNAMIQNLEYIYINFTF
jgi:hypothetical protein